MILTPSKATQQHVFVPDDEHIWLSATSDGLGEDELGRIKVRIDDEEVQETRLVSLRKLPGGLRALPLQNESNSEFGFNDMCEMG